MSNEKNLEFLISRVNEGKKNSLGCILSLDEHCLGKLCRKNFTPIIRFYMKGRINDEKFSYSCNYEGDITKSIGKTIEEVKRDTIILAACMGSHEEASISFAIDEKYYNVFPGSEDYLVLYLDVINADPKNKEEGIRTFFLLIDGNSDNKIVQTTTTTANGMAQLLYSLAISYER